MWFFRRLAHSLSKGFFPKPAVVAELVNASISRRFNQPKGQGFESGRYHLFWRENKIMRSDKNNSRIRKFVIAVTFRPRSRNLPFGWRHVKYTRWRHGRTYLTAKLMDAQPAIWVKDEVKPKQSRSTYERPNSGSVGRLPNQVCDQERLHKKDDIINSAMTSWSKWFFLLSSSLIHVYIICIHANWK